MTASNRLSVTGIIDRARPVGFTFDGRSYTGYSGDTLASALLANDVHLVARSVKYHRPRGILSAGPEEPNALVQLETGARTTPNTRATVLPLYPGLIATSQNRWPTLHADLLATTGLFSRFMPPGFYYKTFMKPRRLWPAYERCIRRIAGLGRAPTAADPDRYEKQHAWCDVLVVGGGAAGLIAALAAARSGVKVMLADERHYWGGAARLEQFAVGTVPVTQWIQRTTAELASLPNVQLLPRTTVFGAYDSGLYGATQINTDVCGEGQVAQRLWLIRARVAIIATGAIERPLVFSGNDRPGLMLASAVRSYASLYAVRAGSRIALCTNNDGSYTDAAHIRRMTGATIELFDCRPRSSESARSVARRAGVECSYGIPVGTRGRTRVSALQVESTENRHRREIECDLVAMSGGWTPQIHLTTHLGGYARFDPVTGCTVPGQPAPGQFVAGGAAGHWGWPRVFVSGHAAAFQSLRSIGVECRIEHPPRLDDADSGNPAGSEQAGEPAAAGRKAFVDFQNDVTRDDIAIAVREGYTAIEHVKRYTMLGMGTDQGKTSQLNGAAAVGRERGQSLDRTGITTLRPPYTPVTLGALAGRDACPEHFKPTRRSPMHGQHTAAGAVFVTAGLWQRPCAYPRAGESVDAAAQREALAVRSAVGIVDVTTLGKIDVQGRGASTFLDRIYANTFSTLPVGKARYGLMLREDGIVLDDGTTTRLGAEHYFMTTTTANAARVLTHLEYHAHVVWPELDVHLESVSDQWAGVAVAGPRSRELLTQLFTPEDLTDAALPFLGCALTTFHGSQARLLRISFSGELAYEAYVPWRHGPLLWESLMVAGAELRVTPYGTDALTILRVEKGHVAAAELNGRVTAEDLGLGRMMSRKKDYIGRAMAGRAGLNDTLRPKLVGLVPADRCSRIPSGAQLVEERGGQQCSLGYVATSVHSPNTGHPVALGFLSGGMARSGQALQARDPLRNACVTAIVVSPVFVDPQNARLHG